MGRWCVMLAVTLAALIGVVCSQPPPPTEQPVATPIPTPTTDIPATIDAAVKAALPTPTPVPTATPVPTPTPTPVPTATPLPTPMPTATPAPGSLSGFDLPAMLPTVSDLPGTLIDEEGFEEDSYSREFESTDLVFDLGASKAIFLSTEVELHASASEARMQASVSETFLEEVAEPVTAEIIKEMEASGMGNTDTTVELADSPTIGDASNVFLIKLKTEAFSLDFYGLFFVQGRVIAELMAVGPPGKLALEDVAHLAQLIDQRIQENSPSP